MTDAYVAVLESSDAAAKQVDNESNVLGGQTRYRQRVRSFQGDGNNDPASPWACRLSDGSNWIDPRNRTWNLNSVLDSVNVGNFPATQAVAGDVASGATDSGNPVKTAGVYNLAQPTLTDGKRGDIQLDSRGNQRMVLHEGNTGNFARVLNSGDGVAAGLYGLYTRSQMMAYNGTSGDLVRGDTTSGLYVQTKAEVATVADAGALPSVLKVVAGYDRTMTQVRPLAVDTFGALRNTDLIASTLDAILTEIQRVRMGMQHLTDDDLNDDPETD